ncbi:MAG: bifunctional response regulator/alkaline phosphatase family protein [Ignavibacteria bacterium]|nr:bifunctional response regulator/alkaline phosphatase family protein [Ignavibacteria bacterium]
MEKNRGKILWIDDEIELLKPHLILLRQKGYEVDTATNGEDGIELVKKNLYDIIFLDEMMLGMSGLDTLVEIKDINPYLPVIMVTKNEAETLMEEAIGRKIDDYLTKPVNPTQILAICKRYLESERINQEKIIQNFLIDTTNIRTKLNENLEWEDWKEIYLKLVFWSLELDKYPSIGFSDSLRDIFREANTVFSDYIERNYKELINTSPSDNRPLLSPEIFEKFVIPNINSKTNLFFFVIDCLRLDQWLVFEEILQQFYKIHKEYYLSILPTATPYARNSIFAGLFPYDIQKYYPQFWVGELNTEDHKQNAFEKDLLIEQLTRKKVKLQTPLTYIKIHETEFGKKVESEIHKYTKNQLTAIVVNSVDMIAHSRSDFAILKEIAPNESAYRSLTRSWFSHSSLLGMLQSLSQYPNVKIILTTDHGSIRCMRGVKVLGDRETSTSLRYKFGKNVKCEPRYAMQVQDLTELKLPKISITVNNIIAKEDYYFVYPTDYHYYLQRYKDSFQHGGISLEEMIIPIVTLEPKNT